MNAKITITTQVWKSDEHFNKQPLENYVLSYKVRHFLQFDAKRFEIKTPIIHYHVEIYIKYFILL